AGSGGGRAALGRAVMGVAGHGRPRAVAIDGLLRPAGAEERHHLRRLLIDGGANGGVVQDGDARRLDARQRRLELERLLDRLAHEALEHRLAPRLQRAIAEAAGEALDTGEADAADLDEVAVEDAHAA